MRSTAIEAVGLTKDYRRTRSHRADFRIFRGLLRPTGREDGASAGDRPTWTRALDSVSFTVDSGEAVGLIGPNGAGKSTLLKVLSRVTPPTGGHVDVNGKVGALIELGTGFHPELTGRENTFLSGAILGMSRRDISMRFDEIVDFAEIGSYIDEPVKRYSSGMYARLGFSVAAFLKPAILIVDEVLSVGDLSFQAKCLMQMRRISEGGTSVLFVSHNMLAIADFCSRALVMSGGRLVYDGATREAVGWYRKSMAERDGASESDPALRHSVKINGALAGPQVVCETNHRLDIELSVHAPEDAIERHVQINLVIETPDGRMAVHLRNDLAGTDLRLGPGPTRIGVSIDELPLAPGSYALWMRVVDLGASPPTIWDTRRITLEVAGQQVQDALVYPRHSYEQR